MCRCFHVNFIDLRSTLKALFDLMVFLEKKEEHRRPFSLGRVLVMALILRVAGIALTLQIAGVSLPEYLEIHDGRDYIAFAAAMDTATLRQSRQWVNVRFPGFPLAVYFLGLILGKAWGLAALLLNIGGALAAIYLFDRIFHNRWATLWFSIFPPSWFLFSSLNATEGFFLFVNLWGISLIWNNKRPHLGCVILGISALVRPFAVFAIAAILLGEFLQTRSWRIFLSAFLCSVPMLLWLGFCRIYYGAIFHNVNQYSDIWGNQVFDWPFRALVFHSLKNPRILKLCLVWGTVLFSLAAAFLALRKWFHDKRSDTWFVLAFWQIFSCLFYFSLGSANPFTSIDRYILTALPAQIASLESLAPRRKIFFYIVAILTLMIVVYWNRNHFVHLAART